MKYDVKIYLMGCANGDTRFWSLHQRKRQYSHPFSRKIDTKSSEGCSSEPDPRA